MLKLHVQGIIASLASATPADVFPSSTGLYPFPAAATATTIVSGSANDAAAGTGAQTAKVTGLGADFREISEVVSLNGTSPVTLVNQYLRVNRVEILTAGTDLTNDGAISVKQSSTVITTIVAGAGRSQMAIYTASINRPGNAIKKLYFSNYNAVVGDGVYTLFTRKVGAVWQIRHIETCYGTTQPSRDISLDAPIYLDPGEDVRVSVTVNANSTAVSAGFDIWEGSSSEFSNSAVI